jgi:hypothetical protein
LIKISQPFPGAEKAFSNTFHREKINPEFKKISKSDKNLLGNVNKVPKNKNEK